MEKINLKTKENSKDLNQKRRVLINGRGIEV
jgi:hypothetical protein